MQEEGEIVDVVCAEYIPAIDGTRATVVIGVKWIGYLATRTLLVRRGKIAALDVNLMGPGIGQLDGQSMFVLHAHSRLEGVITAVGRIFYLGDAAPGQILPVEVCVCSADGCDFFSVRQYADRQSIDCPLNILVPGCRTDILEGKDSRWSQFVLYS